MPALTVAVTASEAVDVLPEAIGGAVGELPGPIGVAVGMLTHPAVGTGVEWPPEPTLEPFLSEVSIMAIAPTSTTPRMTATSSPRRRCPALRLRGSCGVEDIVCI